ncbi:uncharacterized protein LOC117172980 isoform X4 [Belonocnema kinseyi]|uniref:uncharacterized protein LOC117172980 isoform X4 n=1 Tax=Belonocnema kinseyi TaxID=2817044 RepID=UPI00143D8B89|nr:uncharacterized protein LOC117172980 isoform X4 [Belonocnema kinseyi]
MSPNNVNRSSLENNFNVSNINASSIENNDVAGTDAATTHCSIMEQNGPCYPSGPANITKVNDSNIWTYNHITFLDNLVKKERAEGEKGVGRAGITIKPRVMKYGCLEKCLKACFSNISNNDQQLAFNATLGCHRQILCKFLLVRTHSKSKIKRYKPDGSHGR